jgi:mannosyltransferase
VLFRSVAFFLLFALIQLPPERGTRRWWAVLLPPVWIAVSVGIFLVQDLFREANLKFLLPAQIAFALWVGRGVWVLWRIEPREDTLPVRVIPKAAAIVGGLSVFVTLISSIPPLYNDVAYQRDDYRGIVAAITTNPRPGDVIVLNAPGQQEVFDYYYDGAAPVVPLPRGYGGDDAATLTETRQLIADYDRVFAVLWGTEERDPNGIVENTLDAEAYEAISQWYGDVRLVRYITPDDFETTEAVNVAFGEAIMLESYALNRATFAPGDVLQLQLVWRTDTPLTTPYKVFVQLLNPDGTLATQRDAEPGGGRYPTTDWQPGETITDNHALILPEHLPPAHYRLIIGLYNAGDPLARLPVEDNDYFMVSAIHINREQ